VIAQRGGSHCRRALGRPGYAFSLSNGEPFAFAGLWDAWKEPKSSPQAVDTWLQSFTIITATPNELTGTVHNRMPVILRPENYDEWLKGSVPPMGLLHPYESFAMQSSLANPLVGNVRNNGPEMLNSAYAPGQSENTTKRELSASQR
jgi:putative SOS response-associated peptidase YedK